MVLLLGVLVTWSPLAAVLALAGYWLGRTVVLAHALVQHGTRS
jgi:hypothetical protein